MNSATFSKYKVFLLLIFLLIVWQIIRFVPRLQPPKKIDHGPAPTGAIKPVLVSVFYEALCPDSKNFVVKQLLPAVYKAPKLLNVSLIPYGKAKTEKDSNGKLQFTCQHGPVECLANKIHACAVSIISNMTLQVAFISCMISDNMIPELIGENCAKKLGIDWMSISQCSGSKLGSILLEECGNLTDKYVPQIAFVPTILLDNEFKNQAAILKDFFKELCSMFRELPEECITSNKTSP